MERGGAGVPRPLMSVPGEKAFEAPAPKKEERSEAGPPDRVDMELERLREISPSSGVMSDGGRIA